MPHHSNLKHTPFDGSQPLFKIGLQPFDEATWLEIDHCYADHLSEKNRLLNQMQSKVFQAFPSSEQAQAEVYGLVAGWLKENLPEVPIASVQNEPALLAAAKLIQEDLVLLRKIDGFWHIIAGCVCFPSSWSLPDKIGKPMHEVHQPVPGFNEATRNAEMIERIFDNLQVECPVERYNWSVYDTDELYQGDNSSEVFDADKPHFLRSERQTLRKLPNSGDILFTVRIHVDPYEALLQRKDRAEIAVGFIDLLEQLDADQLNYKGLNQGKHVLISKLRELVSNA